MKIPTNREGYSRDELKQDYEKLREKHNLPSFQEMNEDFEIEKLDYKTEFLLREIRRAIMEKCSAYVRFIEGFLNPANCPIFVMALIKGINISEKKDFEQIYLKLAKYEIESVLLDNIYNEKNEAEFVLRVLDDWKETKVKFDEIMKGMLDGLEVKGEKGEKGYLG
jgi:hypothetical protein